jgi:hypothetical protein
VPVADIPEFEAQFTLEPFENHSGLLLRYFKTIVAWIHALVSLNRSKLFRSGLELTLNIVCVPSNPTPNYMLPVEALVDELLPRAVTGDSYDAIRTRLLSMIKSPTSTRFSGTVHCEAMLMALVTACSARPQDEEMPSYLVELLGVNLTLPFDSDAFSVCLF